MSSISGGLRVFHNFGEVRARAIFASGLMFHPRSHLDCVDSWLRRMESDGGVDSVRLLQLAIKQLWKQIGPTLGSVTLSAIVARVHCTALAKFPALESLEVSQSGVSFEGAPESALDDQAREGVRYFLVELLTVIGSLTAEILTPAMHEVLGEMNRADIEPGRRDEGPV